MLACRRPCEIRIGRRPGDEAACSPRSSRSASSSPRAVPSTPSASPVAAPTRAAGRRRDPRPAPRRARVARGRLPRAPARGPDARIANTAGTGKAGKEPLRDLVATYEGWPLIISEYSSNQGARQGQEVEGRQEAQPGRAAARDQGREHPRRVGTDDGQAPPEARQPPAQGHRRRSSRRSTRCSTRSGSARTSRSQLPVHARSGRRGALAWGIIRSMSDASAGPATTSRPAARTGEDVSELDKRIIEHLQADGRRPFTQIALDLGVSEAAVRARTNRLIDRGILQVVGVTDPLKLGFHQMAMVGVRCESDRLVAVAEELAAMPEVDYVVITAGTYDLLDRDRVRGQRGAAALPRGAPPGHRRGARDRDVRVPAPREADLPVGRALGADRLDRPGPARCTIAPESTALPRNRPNEPLRWPSAGRALATLRRAGGRSVVRPGDRRPHRDRGHRQSRPRRGAAGAGDHAVPCPARSVRRRTWIRGPDVEAAVVGGVTDDDPDDSRRRPTTTGSSGSSAGSSSSRRRRSSSSPGCGPTRRPRSSSCSASPACSSSSSTTSCRPTRSARRGSSSRARSP